MKNITLIIAFCIITVSCSNSVKFKNRNAADLHVVLEGVGDVSIMSINGLPTSFWRSSEKFLVPSGKAVITASFSDRHLTCGYKPIEFTATVGHTYEVSRVIVKQEGLKITAFPHPTTAKGWIIHDPRDTVQLVDVTKTKAHEVVLISPREDHVFGEEAATLAIKKYQGETP